MEILVLQKYIMENTFPLYKLNHLKLLYQWIYFRYDMHELIQHRRRVKLEQSLTGTGYNRDGVNRDMD